MGVEIEMAHHQLFMLSAADCRALSELFQDGMRRQHLQTWREKNPNKQLSPLSIQALKNLLLLANTAENALLNLAMRTDAEIQFIASNKYVHLMLQKKEQELKIYNYLVQSKGFGNLAADIVLTGLENLINDIFRQRLYGVPVLHHHNPRFFAVTQKAVQEVIDENNARKKRDICGVDLYTQTLTKVADWMTANA